MHYGKFCGTALPPNACFCMYCRQAVGTTVEQPADINALPTINSVSPDGITTIGNPSHPVQGKNEENQDTRLTTGKEDEEDERKRRLLLGLPLLGVLASEGQAPAANVPMVQGTPQVGGVPIVEGTPVLQHMPLSSAHPQQHASAHLPTRHAPASLRLRPVRYACWLAITFTSVVIVAGVISGLAFFLQPSISLRGSGLFPGSRMTLTLDDGVPLLVGGSSTPTDAYHAGVEDATHSEGSDSMQMAVTLGVAALPPVKCPPEFVRRGGKCVPVKCPPGFVRQGSKCVPVKCPTGLVGSLPGCQPPPPPCPSGLFGSLPNCQAPPQPTCPPGSFGSPPNCQAPQPTCPPGLFGSPPNCQAPPPTPPPSVPTPPVPCPPGLVGSPPDCQQQPPPQEGPPQCPPGFGPPPQCPPIP